MGRLLVGVEILSENKKLPACILSFPQVNELTVIVISLNLFSFLSTIGIFTVKPSPLNNCSIKASLNQSSEILEVECAAGYDGGLKQEYRLEAYEVRTNSLRVNVSSASPDIPLFRIPVGELLPATRFYLTAYAVNAKGKSEVFLLEDISLRDSGKPAGR